jgi:hypothetical protein
MSARLHSTRGQLRIELPNVAAACRAEELMTAASLVASVPAAVNASVCLLLRREAGRFALVLRLATRRPPPGLLAELL